MSRYRQLLELVRDKKPKHVIEIGTWDGKRAIEMMAVSNCYYTGFDLFEEATKEIDKKEHNVKSHNSLVDVGKYIENAGFSKFCLIRGNTNEIFPVTAIGSCISSVCVGSEPWRTEENGFRFQCFDFAFIDGGHSVKTIKNDYEWVSKNIDKDGTIIIDDYYDPELEGFGCNFLKGKGEILPSKDKTPHGIVHFLKI